MTPRVEGEDDALSLEEEESIFLSSPLTSCGSLNKSIINFRIFASSARLSHSWVSRETRAGRESKREKRPFLPLFPSLFKHLGMTMIKKSMKSDEEITCVTCTTSSFIRKKLSLMSNKMLPGLCLAFSRDPIRLEAFHSNFWVIAFFSPPAEVSGE